MEQAKRFDDYVLIEATANQVNQYGGYTNMKPADFREEVLQIAKRIGFSEEKMSPMHTCASGLPGPSFSSETVTNTPLWDLTSSAIAF